MTSVHVTDPQNQPVRNLTKNDFSVSEDGVTQEITSFSSDERPVSYVLTLDLSGSMTRRRSEVLEAASRVINDNKAGDETFIVVFATSAVAVSERFTSDKPQLMRELRGITGAGIGTALIDALCLSLDPLAEQRRTHAEEDRRYAIVLITDGDEHESYYKEKELFLRLAKQDVEVLAVSFTNYPDNKWAPMTRQRRERAVTLQTRVAKDTGGWAFFPDTPLGVQVAASQVLTFLRARYLIGYESSRPASKDSSRKVVVSVLGGNPTPQYKLSFRTGPLSGSK